MNCRQVEQHLFDPLDRCLSARASAAMAAHLARCRACRSRRDAWLAMQSELPHLTTLSPPPHLARRALDRWVAEPAGQWRQPHDNSPTIRPLAWRGAMAISAAALLALLAAEGLAPGRWTQPPWSGPPSRVATRSMAHPAPAPAGETTGLASPPTDSHTGVPDRSRRFRALTAAPVMAAPTVQSRSLGSGRGEPDRSASPSLASNPAGTGQVTRVHAGRHVDDMAFLNGRDPVENVRPWAPVTRDEWDAIEAKIRRQVPARDDFVQIPFPRIAAASEAAVVAAVEQYKREAAVVDPRLFREVTLAQKGTALSDLCDQLRRDTGIQLSAGASVADEKVTLFCEKLPLRDVMRQISHLFGYTWLRSRKEGGEYQYELVQDLRSQLMEEELRNRDRDAALIALDQDMARYRSYLQLSPDEARERAKTAGEADRKLLQRLSGAGWGPIQMYFRLTPAEQAGLRAGQELRFSQAPRSGESPLPEDIARGVLQSQRDLRILREDGGKSDSGSGASRDQLHFTRENEPGAMPPSAVPEARAAVTLKLVQAELGRFTFSGGSDVLIGGSDNGNDNGPYGVGQSPSTVQPGNASLNASLAHDSSLRGPVTVTADARRQTPDASPAKASGADTGVWRLASGASQKLTSADVLEALHRASGMPVVADFYTRLYAPEAVLVKAQPLYEALNHLSDAMRLRWNKVDGWLQFRSASFYNDRLKEVPNRLLSRWAASRQEHGSLRLDDLIEIAGLSDAQLDAREMAEGAKELWGLAEWGLACNRALRPHLRWMAHLSPAEREKLQRAPGLRFTELTLSQQQQFISLASGGSADAIGALDELSNAVVQIDYSLPGQFEWKAPETLHSDAPEPLSPVRAATREAALTAARRLDPQADLSQIQPTGCAVTLLYTWGNAEANGSRRIHTTGPDDTSINSGRSSNKP